VSARARQPELLDEATRRALRELYRETDALLEDSSCDRSQDCCRFGVKGREPYPTAVELALVFEAIRTRGLALPANDARARRRLPMADAAERRCPMLGQDGACKIYEHRPFGCRTFFCDRRLGPSKLPRKEIVALGKRVLELSTRAFPRDPGARPLVAALESGPERLFKSR
jgi:hypothetical protein